MCAECRQTPCAPGCPQAPEHRPEAVCSWCGEPLWGDCCYELEGAVVCEDCLDGRRRYL